LGAGWKFERAVKRRDKHEEEIEKGTASEIQLKSVGSKVVIVLRKMRGAFRAPISERQQTRRKLTSRVRKSVPVYGTAVLYKPPLASRQRSAPTASDLFYASFLS
jgi:hypothetical protein